MRSLLIASALFIAAALSAATNGPFLQVKQTSEHGNVQFVGTNISGQSIVAYVVVAVCSCLARNSHRPLSNHFSAECH